MNEKGLTKFACFLVVCLLVVGCASGVRPPVMSSGVTFSLVVLSDPEVFSYNRLDGACRSKTPAAHTCPYRSGESKDECIKRCGIQSNLKQLVSVKKIDQLRWPNTVRVNADRPIKRVAAGIINGDLTSHWYSHERQAYINFYEKEKRHLPMIPLFVGLGSQDYYSNACDCRDYFPFTTNSCAREAVDSMKTLYQNKKGINFDNTSLSYSFDLGEFHIVQLHLNPSYSVDLNNYNNARIKNARTKKACMNQLQRFNIPRDKSDQYKISDAFEWLARDLSGATSREKFILINMHAPGDGDGFWGARDGSTAAHQNKQYFSDLIEKTNVVGVFGGHIHHEYGYMGDYRLSGKTVRNVFGQTVPWFRSGSSEYGTYLVVELGSPKAKPANYMNVGVVSSQSGTPRFIKGSGKESAPPMTFQLR